MFPEFWTRKILAPGETPDDFREVTEAERQSMEAARDAWEPPSQELINRWNTLCEIADYNYLTQAGSISSKRAGRYNASTGYFELYETLFDITAAEAMKIIEASTAWAGYAVAGESFAGTAYLNSSSVLNRGIRALLPIANPLYGGAISLRGLHYAGVIGLCYYYTNRPVPVSNLRQYDVARCVSPMDISGINYTSGATEGFYSFGGAKVEYILLHGLKCDLPLERCPNIEMECVEYIVAHAANTKAITITLHAITYAKLTDELLAEAAEKNITFTTP